MIQKLYLLWYQGFDQAPYIVQKCIRSWAHYNPSWDMILLDEWNLKDYLPPEILEKKNKMNLTSFSDLIRIALLTERGGIWADATTFCTCPLDGWLEKRVTSGFWAFDMPTMDRLISTWFLYGEPHHLILEKWYRASLAYWEDPPRSSDYFWFHSLFTHLFETDADFRSSWQQIRSNGHRISARMPHLYQDNGYLSPPTHRFRYFLRRNPPPLVKLSYKVLPNHPDDIPVTSVLYHLFQNHSDISSRRL